MYIFLLQIAKALSAGWCLLGGSCFRRPRLGRRLVMETTGFRPERDFSDDAYLARLRAETELKSRARELALKETGAVLMGHRSGGGVAPPGLRATLL